MYIIYIIDPTEVLVLSTTFTLFSGVFAVAFSQIFTIASV